MSAFLGGGIKDDVDLLWNSFTMESLFIALESEVELLTMEEPTVLGVLQNISRSSSDNDFSLWKNVSVTRGCIPRLIQLTADYSTSPGEK